MALPLGLLPVPRQRFWIITDDGIQPLADGTLTFFTAGTDTPEPVFADSDGDNPLGTVVTLDADGYAPTIYVSPIGYKIILKDADGALIWEQDHVEDVGTAFLARLGLLLGEGSKSVETGYVIAADDNLVTVNEPTTDPATVTLQPLADRTLDLTIKNEGPTDVRVTPAGSDLLENVASYYTLPAAVGTNLPTITIRPTTAGYFIVSSHGL